MANYTDKIEVTLGKAVVAALVLIFGGNAGAFYVARVPGDATPYTSLNAARLEAKMERRHTEIEKRLDKLQWEIAECERNH